MELGLLMRNGEVNSLGARRRVGWGELREMARVAEDVGFDTLFVADHFLFRNSPPVVMGDGESRGVWEAWTVLSALAEVTARVTLGPFVACTSFRNPALLAKMADTLDEVSGGRLILGLGAGWHEPEYAAFGYPFDHRVSRFDEALQVIVPLLREGRVDFRGQYYEARECELRPRGPRAGPPIWIGASGPRMLRLVARWADGYNTVWHVDPAEVGGPFASLETACREVGRDPATVRRTAGTEVVLAGPGVELGGSIGRRLSGRPEEIADRLRGFAAAGVTHLTLILDPWEARTIERFGRVIEALPG